MKLRRNDEAEKIKNTWHISAVRHLTLKFFKILFKKLYFFDEVVYLYFIGKVLVGHRNGLVELIGKFDKVLGDQLYVLICLVFKMHLNGGYSLLEDRDVLFEYSDISFKYGDIGFKYSDILFEISDIGFKYSDILFETSDILFETSDILFETSDILFETKSNKKVLPVRLKQFEKNAESVMISGVNTRKDQRGK